jgi:hypothetical protein
MSIFGTCAHVQFADMQYAHKIVKNISSPNSAKMLSFVIILLSSRRFIVIVSKMVAPHYMLKFWFKIRS